MKERHPDTLYPLSDLQEEDGLILLWRLPLDKPPVLAYSGESRFKDDEPEDSQFFTVVPQLNNIVVDGITMSYEWYLTNVLKVKVQE